MRRLIAVGAILVLVGTSCTKENPTGTNGTANFEQTVARTAASTPARDAKWAADQVRPLTDAVSNFTPLGVYEDDKLAGLYDLFEQQDCPKDRFVSLAKADFAINQADWYALLATMARAPDVQGVQVSKADDTEILWGDQQGLWANDAVKTNSSTGDSYNGWRFSGAVCFNLLP